MIFACILSIAVIFTCNGFGITLGIFVILGNSIDLYFKVREYYLMRQIDKAKSELDDLLTKARDGDILHVSE